MSYEKIIERVFLDRYSPGDVKVDFVRDDLVDASEKLGVSEVVGSGWTVRGQS